MIADVETFFLPSPGESFLEEKLGVGIEEWLRQKKYKRIGGGLSRDPCDLCLDFFGKSGPEVINAVRSFARGFLAAPQRMKKLYSPAFLDYLTEQRDEVAKLACESENPSLIPFFTVLSQLTKTRVKVVYFSEEVTTSCKLGSRDWPGRVVVVQHEAGLFAVAKAQNFVCRTYSEQLPLPLDSSDYEDQVAPTGLCLNGGSTTSDSSGLDSLDSPTLFAAREPLSIISPPSSRGYEKRESSSTIDSFTEAEKNPQSSVRTLIHHKFQQNVLHEDKEFKQGFVKFFSSSKEFGFIISNGKEYFLHKDDLFKSGINVADANVRKSLLQRIVEFRVIEYKGNTKAGLKAIDIRLL